MKTIQEFIIKNKDTIKDFVQYLVDTKLVDVNVFFTLPFECSIGVFIKYFESKNISYICDLHSVIVYYVNPKLVVNILLQKHRETGEFTDIVHTISDIKVSNLSESNQIAIEYLLNKLNNPF
jgi:hypothetical protein